VEMDVREQKMEGRLWYIFASKKLAGMGFVVWVYHGYKLIPKNCTTEKPTKKAMAGLLKTNNGMCSGHRIKCYNRTSSTMGIMNYLLC
jgi:hypothetical protein